MLRSFYLVLPRLCPLFPAPPHLTAPHTAVLASPPSLLGPCTPGPSLPDGLVLRHRWITCATLVNLNGWFATTKLRTGDKLGLALGWVREGGRESLVH